MPINNMVIIPARTHRFSLPKEIKEKVSKEKSDMRRESESKSRGSLAWFGRQTHNLENNRGKCAQVSRGRGLESRPRH